MNMLQNAYIVNDLSALQNLVTIGNFKNVGQGKAYIASESDAKIGNYVGTEKAVLDVAPIKNTPDWV